MLMTLTNESNETSPGFDGESVYFLCLENSLHASEQFKMSHNIVYCCLFVL